MYTNVDELISERTGGEMQNPSFALPAAVAAGQTRRRANRPATRWFWDSLTKDVLSATFVALLVAYSLAVTCCGVNAMPVFDCESNRTSQAMIDLKQPAPCPDPVNDYDPPIVRFIQLIQTDTNVPITAYQCLITISKEVVRCGFNSLTYGAIWTVWEKLVLVEPQDCMRAIQTGEIMIDGNLYRGLIKGAERKVAFFSHGNVDINGNCRTADFISNGVAYSNSYERTVIRIHTKAVRGTHDQTTGLVHFTNGIITLFGHAVVRDAFEGLMVWNTTQSPCVDTLSEVYAGDASLHRLANHTVISNTLVGSIILIADNTKAQHAGLILKAKIPLCGVQCYSTQIKGMVACLPREMDTPLPKSSFKKHFDVHAANLQTQLGFLHMGTNMRMHNRFELIQSDLCEVDRRILYSRLQTLAADNPYALLDIYGPGHIIDVAGAAAYITKCADVDVRRVDFPNCTREIPVLHNGRTRFADPMTMVLQDFPTIVTCSARTPIRWLVMGQWYCANPAAVLCSKPEQLKTSIGPYEHLGDFTIGVGSGAFSESQLADARTHRRTRQARGPVLERLAENSVANSIDGSPILGDSFGRLELESLTNKMGDLLFPLFPLFGYAWNTFCGILLLIVMVKGLIDCAYRVYTLWCRHGAGLWLLQGIWETLAAVIRTPAAIVAAAVATTIAPLDSGVLRIAVGHEGPNAPPPSPPSTYRGVATTVAKEREILLAMETRAAAAETKYLDLIRRAETEMRSTDAKARMIGPADASGGVRFGGDTDTVTLGLGLINPGTLASGGTGVNASIRDQVNLVKPASNTGAFAKK